MKKKYIVTEELKKLLEWCMPNKYMKKIKQLKCLTVNGIIENGPRYGVSISFVEIYGGYWSYSRKFFEELSKNLVLPEGIMEVE